MEEVFAKRSEIGPAIMQAVKDSVKNNKQEINAKTVSLNNAEAKAYTKLKSGILNSGQKYFGIEFDDKNGKALSNVRVKQPQSDIVSLDLESIVSSESTTNKDGKTVSQISQDQFEITAAGSPVKTVLREGSYKGSNSERVPVLFLDMYDSLGNVTTFRLTQLETNGGKTIANKLATMEDVNSASDTLNESIDSLSVTVNSMASQANLNELTQKFNALTKRVDALEKAKA